MEYKDTPATAVELLNSIKATNEDDNIILSLLILINSFKDRLNHNQKAVAVALLLNGENLQNFSCDNFATDDDITSMDLIRALSVTAEAKLNKS